MNRTRSSVTLGWVIPLAVLLACTACSGEKVGKKMAEKATEQILEHASGQKVDVKIDKEGKDVHIQTEEGRTDMVETSEWPSDMFAGVPQFSFGKVVRVTKSDERAMRSFNVYLEEIENDAARRYGDQLEAAGWQIQVMQMGTQGAMISGQKGDLGINFAISVERRDGMLAVFQTGSE